MDLLCNPKLVGNIYKAKKKMLLLSNGGNMLVNHKAQVTNCKLHVRFNQKYTTNLIALKNLIKKYHTTYDRLDEMFIVNKKEHRKHNMHSRIHESGLH